MPPNRTDAKMRPTERVAERRCLCTPGPARNLVSSLLRGSWEVIRFIREVSSPLIWVSILVTLLISPLITIPKP